MTWRIHGTITLAPLSGGAIVAAGTGQPSRCRKSVWKPFVVFHEVCAGSSAPCRFFLRG